VGLRGRVTLQEAADGYEQARHALVLARTIPERYSRYRPKGALPPVLGTAARGWASRTLRALLDYRPSRRQDPGSHELTATLMTWLTFPNGAGAALKLHRNTVAARIRHIEALIGRDLSDMAAQAQISLALRVLDQRPSADDPGEAVEIDTLLASPSVRHWAEDQLGPLLDPRNATLLATVRAWLANNARLEATAGELGLSVTGVRKRLNRVEKLLQRSLLDGLCARHDLWLALRAVDSVAVA
jgi:sugar diacid utilization regulator